MNTAQVLVELLKEYRVEHIFGVPGDTTMPLYDALYAARGEITHIMARDERSAAFMADAYARLAHKPGITEAPSGGGATYVIPGVAEANGSSVPMVVFTSDVPITDEGKGTLTAIDQQRLLQAATKWSAVVKRPQMLPDIVRSAKVPPKKNRRPLVNATCGPRATRTPCAMLGWLSEAGPCREPGRASPESASRPRPSAPR